MACLYIFFFTLITLVTDQDKLSTLIHIKTEHGQDVNLCFLPQHPYPTEDEKRQIAGQTNLTLLQVNNW